MVLVRLTPTFLPARMSRLAIHVKNIPLSVTDRRFREVMEEAFGPVHHACLLRAKGSVRARPGEEPAATETFGFVEFREDWPALMALYSRAFQLDGLYLRMCISRTSRRDLKSVGSDAWETALAFAKASADPVHAFIEQNMISDPESQFFARGIRGPAVYAGPGFLQSPPASNLPQPPPALLTASA